jgi:hypothetical protein
MRQNVALGGSSSLAHMLLGREVVKNGVVAAGAQRIVFDSRL